MANIKAMEAKLLRMEQNVERLHSRMKEAYSGKNEKYAHKCYDQLKKAQQDKTEFSNALFTARQQEDYNQSLRDQAREQKKLENERRQKEQERRLTVRDQYQLSGGNHTTGQTYSKTPTKKVSIAGWYPKDNSWVIQAGYKFRIKYDHQGNVTDMLIADPNLIDDVCHLEHIHVCDVRNHGYSKVTYSLKNAAGKTMYRPEINGGTYFLSEDEVSMFIQSWNKSS